MTIRRALILSLGEFGEKDLSSGGTQASLLPKLQDMYRTATDPGLHAAAEWLLRQWKQEAWLKQVNEEWAKDKEQREEAAGRHQAELVTKDKDEDAATVVRQRSGSDDGGDSWPGGVCDGVAADGSRAETDEETQHKKRIGRTFALAAKPVTMEQYRQFKAQLRRR